MAALRQLEALGYGHMSIESVAAESGVSRATVYRRYRDKADLLTAAVAARADGHPVPGPEPLDQLARYLEDFDSRDASSCLEVIGCLLGAHAEPGAMALHRQRVVAPRLAAVGALLAHAQACGELRASADIDVLAQMLLGVVSARRIAGVASDPGWAHRAIALQVRGADASGSSGVRLRTKG